MDAFVFPFRFSIGKVPKIDTASEQYQAQKVASIISTRTGELPLNPLFGTSDPEFDEFDSAGLAYTCNQYFSDIYIDTIFQTLSEDGRLMVEVSFQVNG